MNGEDRYDQLAQAKIDILENRIDELERELKGLAYWLAESMKFHGHLNHKKIDKIYEFLRGRT